MTNKALIAFAKEKLGTAYVYGMKGTIMTEANFNLLQKKYGSYYVWDSDAQKIGQVCVDCSGLISWATGVSYSSSQLYEVAKKIEPISTLQNAPLGAILWKSGHVGIYIGTEDSTPMYIAADGSAYGVRKNTVANSSFTHWLLLDYIQYESELVEDSRLIIDGVSVAVKRILVDGTNYIKIRDVADLLGYEIGYEGNIATLTKQ
ncbi:MAG: hypothetical protein R3Y53_11620 [Bacillota bacterium]